MDCDPPRSHETGPAADHGSGAASNHAGGLGGTPDFDDGWLDNFRLFQVRQVSFGIGSLSALILYVTFGIRNTIDG